MWFNRVCYTTITVMIEYDRVDAPGYMYNFVIT